jgi:hypothetical protein
MKKLLLLSVFIIGIYTNIYSEDLMIFGNKNFNYNNLDLKGDFTRFFSENPDLKTGTFIDQSLKLRISGDISPGVGINATFDDTKVQNDNREITLFLKGENFDGSIGNIRTSFNFSDMIYYNKKTEGIEIKDKKNTIYLLYAKSQGKVNSEIFTGKGNQQEYRLYYYPIVSGSETVLLDSKKLERGTDYEIDYEDGTIYFENIVLPIESSSNIFINYQYEEDEEAFKRYIYGAGFLHDFKKYHTIAGFNYFADKDSKKSLLDDDDSSVKPMSHENYSFFARTLKKNIEIYFEKAFSELDNNTLSDNTAIDRPIKTKWQNTQIRFFREDDFFAFKDIKRDPGFEIIGKKESDVRIDETTSMLSLKRKDFTLSVESSDFDSIIYNDPFLNINKDSITSFNNKKESIVFSFPERFGLRGSIIDEIKENQGVKYDLSRKDISVSEDISSNILLRALFFEEEYIDVLTNVFVKDITKKGMGFDYSLEDGKISYFFENIEDMGKDIKNQNIDIQFFKEQLNTYVSFKTRREKDNNSNVGDLNLTWNINDDFSVGARYNSTVLLEIKDSSEINIENRLYNYRIDRSGDIYDINVYYNKRDKINRLTSRIENTNEMYNIDFSADPYSQYSYRMRGTDIINENLVENSEYTDRKVKFEINRMIDANTSFIMSYDYQKKTDSRNILSDFRQTGPALTLKKSGTVLEYSLSYEMGDKDYFNSQDSDVTIIGEEVKYNLNNKTNITYSFKIREEKKDSNRKRVEDELSYNKNVSAKSYLKIFVKRKEVPEDEGGKEYSYNHTGITFDTNF